MAATLKVRIAYQLTQLGQAKDHEQGGNGYQTKYLDGEVAGTDMELFKYDQSGKPEQLMIEKELDAPLADFNAGLELARQQKQARRH